MNAALAGALVAACAAVGAVVGFWALAVLPRVRTALARAGEWFAACGMIVDRESAMRSQPVRRQWSCRAPPDSWRDGDGHDRSAARMSGRRLDVFVVGTTTVVSNGHTEQSARHLFRPRTGAARSRVAWLGAWPGTYSHEFRHWTSDWVDSRRRGNLGVSVGCG